MKKDGNKRITAKAIEELVNSATTLSEDFGAEVESAVKSAREHPLDAVRARSLYTRILEILRAHDGDLDDAARAAVAAEVHDQVEEIVGSIERPAVLPDDEFFLEHNGLRPRQVVPTPSFNEKTVEMTEGYVDIEKLKLWKGNHRISLQVQEFEEHHGREPEEDELVPLMQGSLLLPSLDKADPFDLKPLAESIARKGVETPPIVSYEGEPKDGNRRIAASLLVVYGKGYDSAQKRRARYIRVWRAPEKTTEDQFEAIVVSRNFERDHKKPWPEYIKAQLVVHEYEMRQRAIKGKVTRGELKRIREEVARDFAIKPEEVRRYDSMIRWSEDFTGYHLEEGRDPAAVRYKTEKNFQWFYELDAGKGGAKLTRKLDGDDELKAVVYDLMFDVLESGTQVRSLYQVVDNADTAQMLLKAHETAGRNPDLAAEEVNDAITEAKRRNVKRRSIGFEAFLKGMVERLGTTPPDQWEKVDPELLLQVRRVMTSTLGAIEGEEKVRAEHGEEIPS